MNRTTLPPISNLATWTDIVGIFDEDGDPLDISAATAITLKLRDPLSDSDVLSGSLAGGEIALINDSDDNKFELTFSSSAMSALDPKTYEVGCILTISGEDVQIILGRLPVLRGL